MKGPNGTGEERAGPAATGWGRIRREGVALPYLLLASAALFWAGNFVVGRALRGSVPPITLNLIRWLLAVVILLPISLGSLRHHWPALRAAWPLLLVLAATGVAGFQSLIYHALTMTTALNALLFITLTPMVIPLLGWLFWRERLGVWRGVGVVVSLMGAVVVIARGDPAHLQEVRVNEGDLWVLGAVLMWAVYSVLVQRRPAALPQLPLFAATALLGLAMLVPLFGWEWASGARATLTGGTLLGMLYVGIFPSVLAFLCWNSGVAQVGATNAGMFMHLMPVFGAGLAVLFLGEQVAWFHFAGAALVLAGIALTRRHPSGAASASPAGGGPRPAWRDGPHR